ncbi:MAG: SPOR domain-containing protein [Bacteroidales bacterium]|nr:SPOR domain-containing protein [Bacteroidales bacterium]
MNKVSVIIILAALTASVSSCDFFRGIAGRPGSAELQQKRERIEMMEARRDSLEKARLDSAARAEKAAADSLYALDTLSRSGLLRNATALSKAPRKNLEHRYYVVAGAFSKPENAERLALRYSAAGFESVAFRYSNSLTAVFVAPCDCIYDALEAYRKVMQLPFASKNTWVLVNE